MFSRKKIPSLINIFFVTFDQKFFFGLFYRQKKKFSSLLADIILSDKIHRPTNAYKLNTSKKIQATQMINKLKTPSLTISVN